MDCPSIFESTGKLPWQGPREVTVDIPLLSPNVGRSHRWDSNPCCCDYLSQSSSTQPTTPQEYSSGETDRVWPGAYHTKFHRSCRWGSNPCRCNCLSQPSSTQPIAPQRYSTMQSGRQSLIWPLPHYSPFFISEWSVMTLLPCPPWPPILTCLDPQSWPALSLTPCAWSTFTLNPGPPWLPIVICLGPRFWPALTFYGIHSEIPSRNSAVHQFAVDTGISDTKCHSSHHWVRTDATMIVWVSRQALNLLRHKSTLPARETESDLAPTTWDMDICHTCRGETSCPCSQSSPF